MKRGILLVLIGLLLLTSMTACGGYRRSVVTTPETTVGTDGARGTRNFHYRADGQLTDGSRTHGTVHHGYRHDGLVTDTDGIIGNGMHADGHRTTRRAAVGTEGTRTAADIHRAPRVDGRDDGMYPQHSAYRSDLVAR